MAVAAMFVFRIYLKLGLVQWRVRVVLVVGDGRMFHRLRKRGVVVAVGALE